MIRNCRYISYIDIFVYRSIYISYICISGPTLGKSLLYPNAMFTKSQDTHSSSSSRWNQPPFLTSPWGLGSKLKAPHGGKLDLWAGNSLKVNQESRIWIHGFFLANVTPRKLSRCQFFLMLQKKRRENNFVCFLPSFDKWFGDLSVFFFLIIPEWPTRRNWFVFEIHCCLHVHVRLYIYI